MLGSMKDFFIEDAAKFDGQSITTYFAVSSLSVREKKGGGGHYLALTLSDKTGIMEARMWDDFAASVANCSEGCYVKVQGQISKYQGKFQITLTKLRAAATTESQHCRLRSHNEIRYSCDVDGVARLRRCLSECRPASSRLRLSG